jgi:Domain of unknown function (DUF4184)
MPFTVSHAAAVLPLAIGRPGRTLVPTALVIGSMVPDLPYFVPPYRGSDWTHAAYGPVTVDLAAGLALLAIWHFLLVRPLADFAPTWMRQRLPHPVPLRGARWGWAALSVVLGSYTHVLLDAFTHPGRWGTTHLAWLNSPVGPLPAFKWLQFGLGVFGLLVLAVWAVVWLDDARPRSAVRSRLTSSQRAAGWLTVLVAFVASVVMIGVSRFRDGLAAESVAVAVVTGSMSLTTAVVICLCLAWQVGAWLDRGSRQSPAEGAERGPG